MARGDARRVKRVALALMLLAASAGATAGKPKRAPKPVPAAAPAPDSPAALLAEIPALPKAAAADLRCAAREAFARRLDEIRDRAAPAQGAPAEWHEPTDAQQQAVLALSDLDFSACVVDLRQRPAELWIAPAQGKLDERLAAARNGAQALAAATQFLKDVQPAYAAYLKDVAACVNKREAIMAVARGARGDLSTEGRLLDATEDDGSLVSALADVQADLCATAKKAAARNPESASP